MSMIEIQLSNGKTLELELRWLDFFYRQSLRRILKILLTQYNLLALNF